MRLHITWKTDRHWLAVASRLQFLEFAPVRSYSQEFGLIRKSDFQIPIEARSDAHFRALERILTHCNDDKIFRLPRLGSRVRIPSPAPVFLQSGIGLKPTGTHSTATGRRSGRLAYTAEAGVWRPILLYGIVAPLAAMVLEEISPLCGEAAFRERARRLRVRLDR